MSDITTMSAKAVTDIEKINEILSEAHKKGFLIILPSAITEDSYYRPVLEKVYLSDVDIYSSKGKWRIHFSGLTILGEKAGVEWSPTETRRTDPMLDKDYVSFMATGGIRKSDGKLYFMAASYDIDLDLYREVSYDKHLETAKKDKKTGKAAEEYAEFCTKRDYRQKRTHKVTIAESCAKARVLRAQLGLQKEFSNKAILLKPIFVVRFVLDHQHPDVKKVFLSTAQQSMNVLYGGGNLPARIPHNDPDIVELEPVEEHDQFDEMNGVDGNELDFQAQDLDDQVKTIQIMCSNTGYDIKQYLKRAGVRSVSELSDQRRLGLFQHLQSIKSDDDIPF